MRLGIFGGSFDPVHYGHLLAAELCREHCRLEEVWFLPAAVSPHKPHAPPASAVDRAAMLTLASAGQSAFRVSTLEIDRGGLSYTVDTLAAVRELRPEDELFFILGGDSLAALPTWREPRRICELATPTVVARPFSAEPDWAAIAEAVGAEAAARIQAHVTPSLMLGISSSDIRRRAAEGRSIRFQTPRAVEQYIHTHGLYRTTNDSPQENE